MNRRSFLGTLGVFSILPGAGRVWRAMRPVPEYRCILIGPTPKTTLTSLPWPEDLQQLANAFFDGGYAHKDGRWFRIRNGVLVPIPA